MIPELLKTALMLGALAYGGPQAAAVIAAVLGLDLGTDSQDLKAVNDTLERSYRGQRFDKAQFDEALARYDCQIKVNPKGAYRMLEEVLRRSAAQSDQDPEVLSELDQARKEVAERLKFMESSEHERLANFVGYRAAKALVEALASLKSRTASDYVKTLTDLEGTHDVNPNKMRRALLWWAKTKHGMTTEIAKSVRDQLEGGVRKADLEGKLEK